MTPTTPRADYRRRMPPLEAAIIMQVAGVPVVLARSSDPHVVRGAIETALRSAKRRDDIAGRQQTRMLSEILSRL